MTGSDIVRFLCSWTLGLWVLTYAFLADSAFKIFNDTPDWGWHPLDRSYWHFVAGLALYGLMMAMPYARLAGCLCMAGLLGNWMWTLNPEGVANPFVTSDGNTAYNFADLCLLYSKPILIVGVIAQLFLVYRRTRINLSSENSHARPSQGR